MPLQSRDHFYVPLRNDSLISVACHRLWTAGNDGTFNLFLCVLITRTVNRLKFPSLHAVHKQRHATEIKEPCLDGT